MSTTLALFARHADTERGFRQAAERAGLSVTNLTADPSSVVEAAAAGSVFRAPGGLIGAAIAMGAPIRLAGPNPSWFTGLGSEITGRTWQLCGPRVARHLVAAAPTFVKLADGKHPRFPARRYSAVDDLDAAVAAAGGSDDLQLLATSTWLDIDSEYRVFTLARDVLTYSVYRVEDEPWTPLLHTHRASFHEEAAGWVTGLLADLPQEKVPPSAVLDVARLADGRLVLLEANQCWGAGLYGCDPHRALFAVLEANAPSAPGQADEWLWRPDVALHQ